MTLSGVLSAAGKVSYFITDVYHHWGQDAGTYWKDFAGLQLIRGQMLSSPKNNGCTGWHGSVQEERIELATRELHAANLELQQLDQLKTDFIADMSHELRSPITAIRGGLDYLERTIQKDDNKSYLALIDHNLSRMTHLVSDMLELTRIDAGKMDWHFEENDLADAFVSVDTHRYRRGVHHRHRDETLPFRLQRRDVEDDAAARVRALARDQREDIARDAEILQAARQDVGIRRDIAAARATRPARGSSEPAALW